MGYNKWVKLPKLDCFKKFEMNIPSCRVFYELSENHKNTFSGPLKFKL